MYDFSKNEWGLVLAGGGGKGAYQAGVFRALAEKRILDYITAISGASVGALNLLMYATGEVEKAQNIWKSISPEQFLSINTSINGLEDGFLSRKGIEDIIDKYVDLDIIRDSEKSLYVSTTELSETGEEKVKYFSLNYRQNKQIKDIILASAALPIIYSAVEIEGKMYRDGGLTDNLPIRPLYIEGIRNFIVVGLSTHTEIDYSRYPGCNFLFIKPRKSIGDFFDGTLDFTSRGAKTRMEIGYLDAIRELEFFGREDSASRREYEMAAANDYLKIDYMSRQNNLEDSINSEINKINSLFNKYL